MGSDGLTRDEVLAMPAGREMDALIAPLMGWEYRDHTGLWTNNKTRQWSIPVKQLPKWSETVKAAWEVVERFRAGGFGTVANTARTDYGPKYGQAARVGSGMNMELQSMDEGTWFVAFFEHGGGFSGPRDGHATAETFPLAVCRAALLSKLNP